MLIFIYIYIFNKELLQPQVLSICQSKLDHKQEAIWFRQSGGCPSRHTSRDTCLPTEASVGAVGLWNCSSGLKYDSKFQCTEKVDHECILKGLNKRFESKHNIETDLSGHVHI